MRIKYRLVINGDATELPDDNIKNWDEVKCVLTRKNYEGVTRSISSKFEFVGAAYDLILEQWLKRGLDASVTVEISTINNRWEYSEFFRCPLDFSTMSYTPEILSISGIDQTLAAQLKAKGKTTYEFPVSEIKENEPLDYRHIDLESTMAFKINGENVSDVNYETQILDIVNLGITECKVNNRDLCRFVFLPCFYIEDGDNYSLSGNDTVKQTVDHVSDGIPVCRVLKDVSQARIKFNLKISLSRYFHEGTNDDKGYTWRTLATPQVRVSRLSDGAEHILGTINAESGQTTALTETVTSDLKENDCIIAYFVLPYLRCEQDPYVMRWEKWELGVYKDLTPDKGEISFSSAEIFRITTQTAASTGDNIRIDIIKPQSVLRMLLRSMTGREVPCSIEPSGTPRMDNAMLMAAESIRDINGAKLYTSYEKFCQWMEAVFGYVPVIPTNGESLVFMHRNGLFNTSRTVRLDAALSDIRLHVDSSALYSSVKAGYDKQEYSQANGRYEFRFSAEYTTGIILSDKRLELISPYRADSYGIEFMILERGDKTSDTRSDKDVFFVCAKKNPVAKSYEFVRDGYKINGVVSPETMYNSMYSPMSMIHANARYIGSFADMLSFTSSNGNTDVTINGISITDDIELPGSLFQLLEASVSTPGAGLLAMNPDAEYIFQSNGMSYTGILRELRCSLAKNEPETYKLIITSITPC